MEAVTIPVMAKCRIGHFAEAQILEALGVDMVDESEGWLKLIRGINFLSQSMTGILTFVFLLIPLLRANRVRTRRKHHKILLLLLKGQ